MVSKSLGHSTHTASSGVFISNDLSYLHLSKDWLLLISSLKDFWNLHLSLYLVCIIQSVNVNYLMWTIIITVLTFSVKWACASHFSGATIKSEKKMKQSAWGNLQLGQRKKLTQPYSVFVHKTTGGWRECELWTSAFTYSLFLDSGCTSSSICSYTQILSSI